MDSPPITVVILTQNEEKNIEPCLASVASFADVHVLDSGSTDATVDTEGQLATLCTAAGGVGTIALGSGTSSLQ